MAAALAGISIAQLADAFGGRGSSPDPLAVASDANEAPQRETIGLEWGDGVNWLARRLF